MAKSQFSFQGGRNSTLATKTLMYQLPKSVLNTDMPLEQLLTQTAALDYTLSEKTKEARVHKIKQELSTERSKFDLLQMHEQKVQKALRKSKSLIRSVQAARKEATAKKEEQVRKRIAEQERQYEARIA